MAYWLTHLGKFLFCFFSTFSEKKKNRVFFFFSWKSLTSTDSRLKKKKSTKSVKRLCSRQFLRNTWGSIPQNFPFSHFWDFEAVFFFPKVVFFFNLFFFFSWKSLKRTDWLNLKRLFFFFRHWKKKQNFYWLTRFFPKSAKK